MELTQPFWLTIDLSNAVWSEDLWASSKEPPFSLIDPLSN